MLALTWCHRTPGDVPTSVSIGSAISSELKHDSVAGASYVWRQGGATVLPHQGCPVTVRDCQAVQTITILKFVNVKGGELQ